MVLHDEDMPQEDRSLAAYMLEKKIADRQHEVSERKRAVSDTHYDIEGETLQTTSWTKSAKGYHTKESIYEFKCEESEVSLPQYESRPKQMAEMAQGYYDSIQEKDLPDEYGRMMATEITLEHCDVHLSDNEYTDMDEELTAEDLADTLRLSNNGKAPGMDGIPYDFYKLLNIIFKQSKGSAKEAFDVLSFLKELYQDIEKHGIVSGTHHIEWLAPLFKKGDRALISNYRPVTLLNCDYKLMTKTYSLKLMNVAPSLVHPNQAGFMKGRKIEDQVKLTKFLLNYAEVAEEKGIIVALDQEKAYDRINHNYLLRVLEHMGFPPKFCNTIKSFYTNAQTVVMVNGELSKPFTVICGVRQGDPLSCLLFNLAIEPLACLIRNSGLKGVKIPGKDEELVVSLFADDTTVFLSCADSLKKLWEILRVWCAASTAKFNDNKTVLLPFGSPFYREKVIQDRRLNDNTPLGSIEDKFKIVPDGQTCRMLGAWIGNNVPYITPWPSVLEKISKDLERWKLTTPTLEGKQHIINMVIGGRTQYLTKVQGMPKEIEETLIKTEHHFLWDGKKARVAHETMLLNITDGGKQILDIPARNEAIDLWNLQLYLAQENERASWCYFFDYILKEYLEMSYLNLRPGQIMNVFLQDIHIPISQKTPLPEEIKRMILAARNYDLKFTGLSINKDLRLNMPIWRHPAVNKTLYQSACRRDAATCLRLNHEV
jgi:hypothetical protein